jgi:GNAT superfamily N-acetyltransferase
VRHHERFQLRIVNSSAIIDLRHKILRAGMPRESAVFEADELPGTIHVAAFEHSPDDSTDQSTAGSHEHSPLDPNRLVGCASINHGTWEGQPAWQLRGMAVETHLQRSGVGRLLLLEVERLVRLDQFSRKLWCNARLVAIGFYQRNGWTIASDRFEIPTAGPHHRMIRTVE